MSDNKVMADATIKTMTVAAMKTIADKSEADPEIAHIEADDLLCSLLRVADWGDLVDEYDRVKKWYS